MAIFEDKKITMLKEKYLEEQHYEVDHHKFSLTLDPIVCYSSRIVDYNWIVKLDDGKFFNAKMTPTLLGYPDTRVANIIQDLKKIDKYEDDYLANAINDKIDEIYRESL
ncbi:hypothetical protein [Planococcus versutus]|uniref:Uncharacterized protein n=1 Tax=Planococcus versutus TaxID=1302659 RepID=A0A1B1RXZ0_9BACL|nr:hypothetical protein [Planococcus versutus]ANU25815.1 hypothetical protein I858_001830 [Planococcus versutus]